MFEFKIAWIVLPVIGALIGWSTNYIAVKMIFHPRQPVYILGFPIQGLMPKRRRELAHQIAETVERELITNREIAAIVVEESKRVFSSSLEEKVDNFLKNKIASFNPLIAAFISEDMKKKIKIYLMKEFEAIIPEASAKIVEQSEENIKLKQIIYDKIEGFDIQKLEDIVMNIAKTEFFYIEVIGAVLGFIIGLVQIAVVS